MNQDAHIKEWPFLFEKETEAGKNFIDRADELVVDLIQSDLEQLKAMSSRYSSTLPSLVLQVLFEFFYGYYLLAKMRRERFGFFADRPLNDPAAGTPFTLDDNNQLLLMVPHRLWLDLDAIAQREGIERHILAGLIVRRYVEGHADIGQIFGALEK